MRYKGIRARKISVQRRLQTGVVVHRNNGSSSCSWHVQRGFRKLREKYKDSSASDPTKNICQVDFFILYVTNWRQPPRRRLVRLQTTSSLTRNSPGPSVALS